MSISKRITLYSTGLLFIILLLVNGGIYLLFDHLTSKAELDRIANQATAIAASIKHDRTVTARASELLSGYVPSHGMIRVIRENGKEAIIITKDPNLRGIPSIFTNSETTRKVQYIDTLYAVANYPVIWEDGSVVSLEYSEAMTTYETTMKTLRIVLLVASFTVLIPIFLAGRSLSALILKPIKSLQNTMERIREEGTFQRLDVHSRPRKDELDQMGETFNRMIDLLESNYEKQQQFISDASHELRTPLTVIESYARLLKRWGMSDPSRLKEAVEAIHEESKRMTVIIKQLLTLATNEQSVVNMPMERVNLSKVTEITARTLSVAFERDIMVESNDDYFVLGNELQLKQMLIIIIENGLKYSTNDLFISIEKESPWIKVSIRDEGIGIPREDLPNIFNRFYRVDKARNRKTGGSGLGLSIAKTIVEAHKGTIKVESTVHKGSTFTILLLEVQEGDA